MEEAERGWGPHLVSDGQWTLFVREAWGDTRVPMYSSTDRPCGWGKGGREPCWTGVAAAGAPDSLGVQRRESSPRKWEGQQRRNTSAGVPAPSLTADALPSLSLLNCKMGPVTAPASQGWEDRMRTSEEAGLADKRRFCLSFCLSSRDTLEKRSSGKKPAGPSLPEQMT